MGILDNKEFEGLRPLGTFINMFQAMEIEDIGLLKTTIASGANIDERDENGWTILMHAVFNNKVAFLKELINAGASIDSQCTKGDTALDISVIRGNYAVAQLLLNHGADPNTTSNNGYTPIMSAMVNKNKRLIELLLKKGGDINARDNDGMTVLANAPNYAPELTGYLLEKGADPNIVNYSGASPIMYACERGQIEDVRSMLAKGANVSQCTKDGTTLLMLTCMSGNTGMVKLLLDKSAEVNAKRNDGVTALMTACQYGHGEVVDLLIKHGADVNAKTTEGVSAGMLAANVDIDIFDKLVEAGAVLQPMIIHPNNDDRITAYYDPQKKTGKIENHSKTQQNCPKCGREMESGITCTNCGYTEWGGFLAMIIFGVIMFVAGLYLGHGSHSAWRIIGQYGLMICGFIFVVSCIINFGNSLKKRKR